MAFVRPSLVVDSTTTSGTGTYTLTDSATPGGGFRTLADAVADGDVSASDTISYFVVDTTSEGAGLTWEHGVGTVGVGGLTLARTTIIESSNGDAAVSWPSGGSRTVRFGAGTSGFAQLAAAQTFTALQTFNVGLITAAGARFQNNFAGRMILDNAGVIRGQLWTSTTPTVRLDHVAADGTTVDSRIELGAGTVNVSTGTLQQGGTAVALQGVLSAPTGTRLTFHTTPPTGWTRVNVTGERLVKLATSSDTIAATGGSWPISGLSTSVTVEGHTLTESQIPSHSHGVPSGAQNFIFSAPPGGAFTTPGAGTSWIAASATGTTGGGGSHDHTASGSTSGDGAWRPAFSIACIGEKS